MTASYADLLPGPALLFCPADRPDRFVKAATAADGVILDLEDGLRAADREAARANLREVQLDPERTIVRINPAGTPDHDLDLVALARTPYRTVMLAKAERAADVRQLAALFNTGGDPDAPALRVIVLCETALGVLNAPELAAEPATAALMWGAEDLVVSLGGRSSRHPDGGYRDVARHARSRVLLASAAHDVPAIDAVHLDFGDLDGLAVEAADAAAPASRRRRASIRARCQWCARRTDRRLPRSSGLPHYWRRRGAPQECSPSRARWSTNRS